MNLYQLRFVCIGLLLLASAGVLAETIRLQPDPGFARGVDWVSFPQKGMNSMVVAADGSVFMSSNSQNCVFKFGPDGKFLKRFGRKGEGPGDFNGPKVSSILDGRLLVIGEYSLSRRISFFDLDGRLVKILRTKGSCYQPLALKGNRVAYLGVSFDERKTIAGGGVARTDTVNIIDVGTGRENTVVSLPRTDRSAIPAGDRYTISIGSFTGETFLASTPEGELLVGSSESSAIKLYSPEAKLLRTIDLKISNREVSDAYISRLREEVLKIYGQNRDPARKQSVSPYLQALEKFDFRKLFGDRLPAYSLLQVTQESRLLVLPFSDQVGEAKGPFRFKIYDLTGRPTEDLVIEPGSFQLELDKRFRSLELTPNALYALVTIETEDGEERRIIRVSRRK